jgi:hypothetical protein
MAIGLPIEVMCSIQRVSLLDIHSAKEETVKVLDHISKALEPCQA